MVTALGRAQAPPPTTVNALTGLLSDEELWIHAAYGLGAMGRRLRQQGQLERSRAITKTLLTLLEKSKSHERTLHALRALANAADPLALDAAKPFAHADDATIRLAAVQALEPIRDPQVDSLLAERLGIEDRANVLRVVSDALAERPPTDAGRQAALRLAGSDHETSSRVAAIELLGVWRDQAHGTEELLRRLGQNDPDERVRKAAGEALEKLAKPTR